MYGDIFIMFLNPRPQWAVSLKKHHRRRTNTEEKAKVVAAVWGTEFLQFLSVMAVLHWDELKEKNEIVLFFKIFLGK